MLTCDFIKIDLHHLHSAAFSDIFFGQLTHKWALTIWNKLYKNYYFDMAAEDQLLQSNWRNIIAFGNTGKIP